MGHASHEPWQYRQDNDFDDEQETFALWQQHAEQTPGATPYVPPVLDSDPFSGTDEPPPLPPWDTGRGGRRP